MPFGSMQWCLSARNFDEEDIKLSSMNELKKMQFHEQIKCVTKLDTNRKMMIT